MTHPYNATAASTAYTARFWASGRQSFRAARLAVLAGAASSLVITAALAEPLVVTTDGTLSDWSVDGTATVLTDSVTYNFGGNPFTLSPKTGEDMVEIRPSGSSLTIETIDEYLGLIDGTMLSVVGSGYPLDTTNYGAIVQTFDLAAGTYTYGWAYAAGDYLPFTDGVFSSISGAASIRSIFWPGMAM